jgi:two-component system chemotaxis sensor kinase CheA
MDPNQFLDIFLEESNEHLESLNNCLLELERNPADREVLDEIFRISHTIKGMAGTMGFNRTAELTHEMENLLDDIRKHKISVDTGLVDLLFECLDELQIIINTIALEGVEGDKEVSLLINRLRKVLNKEEIKVETEDSGQKNDMELNMHESGVVSKAKQQGFNCFIIEVRLDKSCMLKSARAFVIFNTLEKKGEIIKSYPSVEDIEDERFNDLLKLVLISRDSMDEIRKSLDLVSEISDIKIHETNIPDEIDNINVNEETAGVSSGGPEDRSLAKKSITGKTVRVDIERLDNLMNLVSELIIIKTRLEENKGDEGSGGDTEALEYLERITTNLHDAVMKVRMVPIERVFNRFPRMVRDLSKDLGKRIKLYMYGEETEVDRTVIDEIGDPLIHLIRNSIDHGIEQVDERNRLGKPSEGKVTLRAFHDGNTVVIEVEDDGKGIDVKKVSNKAVELDLYSRQQIEQLSHEELTNLIFYPGFSTSLSVSDLSGRGVGLDVVKTKIESLGGMVEVESEPDIGTKFVIRLPLTLAIIQALLVSLGRESYAIPLSSIKEIVTMEHTETKKVQDREVVMLRGELLPVVRLDKELEVEERSDMGNQMTVVVVKKGEKLAGMVVDSLIGQQEIVIKALGKYLVGIKHIAGATILGDGRVSLILDTNQFF